MHAAPAAVAARWRARNQIQQKLTFFVVALLLLSICLVITSSTMFRVVSRALLSAPIAATPAFSCVAQRGRVRALVRVAETLFGVEK
jgi:hypothetical protein